MPPAVGEAEHDRPVLLYGGGDGATNVRLIAVDEHRPVGVKLMPGDVGLDRFVERAAGFGEGAFGWFDDHL